MPDEQNNQLLDAVMNMIGKMAEELRSDMAEHGKRLDARLDAIVQSRHVGAGHRKTSEPKLDSDEEDPSDFQGVAARRTAADHDARSDSVSRSEFAALASSIAKLKKQQEARPMANLAAFEDVQTKADAVLREHGERASPQLPGEDIVSYSIRLHRPLQKFSPKWKSVDLGIISADRQALGHLLAEIRTDAVQAARNPTGLKEFQHREIVEQAPGGHTVTRFVGNGTIFKQLSRPVRHVHSFTPRFVSKPT